MYICEKILSNNNNNVFERFQQSQSFYFSSIYVCVFLHGNKHRENMGAHMFDKSSRRAMEDSDTVIKYIVYDDNNNSYMAYQPYIMIYVLYTIYDMISRFIG